MNQQARTASGRERTAGGLQGLRQMGQEQGEPPQGTVTTDSDNKQTGEKHTHRWRKRQEINGSHSEPGCQAL